MSGGFFRGTTADQDTRFSNKQAKLMKSQKFAPELENLIDMAKVKMDVMRPWIAHRVTELLGFEDEVLINFIYGLLEEKVVNGKKIQITLTGFMEKNTGKFMKELWTHLLSAQKNASGVPQEFLDAKAEEAMKKKVETDRIASEIQRKKEKEGQELEQERMKKMGGDDGVSRANIAALEPSSRHGPKDSRRDEKDLTERNGSRGRSRRRPSRSINKSPNSSSLSKNVSRVVTLAAGRRRSRSISISPQPGRRSVSSGKNHRSPSQRSVTPRQSFSPPRRESSKLRQRSMSRSPIRHRSRSPVRRRSRSPMRLRSRSPMRRRSRSPERRRSPIRRRSRSPMRRRSRSPMRRRSRSPMRGRSRSHIRRRSRPPVRARSRSPGYRFRSPLCRRSRSPLQRSRSQSPMRPITPSPEQRGSPSPARGISLSPAPGRSPSPVRGRSPPTPIRRYRRAPSSPRRRSPSPFRRRPSNAGRQGSANPRRTSLSPQERTSLSPIQSAPGRRSPVRQRSPLRSPRDNLRTIKKYSPVRPDTVREKTEHTAKSGKGSGSSERRHVSERSPRKDIRDRNDLRNKAPALSPSPFKSPSYSESPPAARITVVDRRSSSPESPVEQMRDAAVLVDSARLSMKKDKPIRENLESVKHEDVHFAREDDKKFKASAKTKMQSIIANHHTNSVEKARFKKEPSPEIIANHRSREVRSHTDNAELRKKDQKPKSLGNAGRVPYDAKSHDRLDDLENVSKLPRKIDGNGRSGTLDSGSEETDDQRVEVKGKRKHKRSRKKDVTSDDDGDDSDVSHVEERKEAKRRHKEEKKLKKEERRRRRAERRRRRDDRHSKKQKGNSGGTISPPSDFENNHDGSASEGERVARKKSRLMDHDDALSEQKRLENELREKALESLRAKKGVGH